METSVAIVNKFAKKSILDVAGVFGYNDSYHQPLGTVGMLTSKLLLFFFMKEKAPGAGKTDIRLP